MKIWPLTTRMQKSFYDPIWKWYLTTDRTKFFQNSALWTALSIQAIAMALTKADYTAIAEETNNGKMKIRPLTTRKQGSFYVQIWKWYLTTDRTRFWQNSALGTAVSIRAIAMALTKADYTAIAEETNVSGDQTMERWKSGHSLY